MRRTWIGVVVAGLVLIGQSPVAAQSTGTAQKPAEPKAKQQAVSQVAADVYVCPMHPEVTAAKAGRCPKCGMALEKKTQKPSAVQKEHRAQKGTVDKGKCLGSQDPCSGCKESCDEH